MSTHLFGYELSHTGRMTSRPFLQKTLPAAILILLPVLIAMTLPLYAVDTVKTPMAVSAINTDVPFAVEISKDFWGLYWRPIQIPVVKTAGSKGIEGFDFLVTYDATRLTCTGVAGGILFDSTGLYQWEYLNARIDSLNPPLGSIRIVAVADLAAGEHHPLDKNVPDGTTLFTLEFYSDKPTLEPFASYPLHFSWNDCGDNAIVSDPTGDTLLVSDGVYEWSADHYINIADPESDLPTILGTPDQCIASSPPGSLVRFVDYYDGQVTLFGPDSVDSRGDINLNAIAYEVADWVMYYNYFFDGVAAFTGNPGASIANSDINADGVRLRVEDLVFLARVVIGDTLPYPGAATRDTLFDSVTVVQDLPSGTVSVESAGNLAALYLLFEGEITPTSLLDPSQFTVDARYDGQYTRVMVNPQFPNLAGTFAPGPLFTYTGAGLLLEKESEMYPGGLIYDFPQAADGDDTHFYRNHVRIDGQNGRTITAADPLSTALARVSYAETLILYLGDFDGYAVSDINAATLLVNDTIAPLTTTVLPSYPGFTGTVMEMTVNARSFILSTNPSLASGGRMYTVAGTFSDDQAFAVTGIVTFSSDPATIFVPTGWPTIQAAIDAAIDGDMVQVAPGTYTGDGNRDLAFNGKQIMLVSMNGALETEIDCQGGFENWHRFIHFFEDEDSTTVVDGFTVTGGAMDNGGAIRIDGFSSPTIRRCRFVGNNALFNGGAIYSVGASPVISDCDFEINSADSANGVGGAISIMDGSPKIQNCTFTSNSAAVAGGAINIVYGLAPLLQNCLFRGNQSHLGGALNLAAVSPTVEYCTIDSNAASTKGGGVHCYNASPMLAFCQISRNSAGTDGGGLSLDQSAAALTNCTIAENSANTGTGLFVTSHSAPHIDKSIISMNGIGGAFVIDGTSSVVFTCTDIAGNYDGEWEGAIEEQRWINGNLFVDPLFCNVFEQDFQLDGNSICLPWNNYCRAQIGAYGFACGFVCGDVNGDSTGNVGDAVHLINYIFRSGPAPQSTIAGDVNVDGEINTGDAIAIINYVFREEPLLNCFVVD